MTDFLSFDKIADSTFTSISTTFESRSITKLLRDIVAYYIQSKTLEFNYLIWK